MLVTARHPAGTEVGVAVVTVEKRPRLPLSKPSKKGCCGLQNVAVGVEVAVAGVGVQVGGGVPQEP